MNEKTYNMYLKMIKLACNNIAAELCRINGLPNNKLVQVRIRNKEQLVNYVGRIIHNSTDAVALYSNKIEPLLVVTVSVPLVQTLTPSVVFIESIIKSKDARVCQKQLMDYTMAEMYLNEAYMYDMKHPYNQAIDSALEKAKDIISKIYSINFLSNFGVSPKVFFDKLASFGSSLNQKQEMFLKTISRKQRKLLQCYQFCL